MPNSPLAPPAPVLAAATEPETDRTAWARLQRSVAKPVRCVVGLMSGTSLDGVDAARVRISGSGRETSVTLEAFKTLPFPADLRAMVLNVCAGEGNALAISTLNFALGRLFADAAETVAEDFEIDAVASHGQTISHSAGPTNTHAMRATLQIGEATVIAQRLNTIVVSDFRAADVALGGQGAPLIPYADWCLLTHATNCRAIQNIGGIGNVTFLPADSRAEQVLGFDTGPGNMLLDACAQDITDGRLRYDVDGTVAARGTPSEPLLAKLLAHPFLQQKPPKSAGREEFGAAYYRLLKTWAAAANVADVDLAATLTHFTARTIATSYRKFLPTMPNEIIVGGGGAQNPTLMRVLSDLLAPVLVRMHEDFGMNSNAKEAVAFAILANETLLGQPSNLPSVTGASRSVVLGKITIP